MPTFTENTVVFVRPFSRQKEGEEVIIGRVETGVFLSVPLSAVEVLEHLAEGKSVGEAGELYRQKYGSVPDLEDFLNILEVKGIVARHAQEDEPAGGAPAGPARVRYHFSNFPQPLAQRIFSRPVLLACFALIGAALAAYVRDPGAMPKLRDLYVTDHRTLIWTLLLIGSYGSVIIHEFAHVIAARSLGINSRLGFGHRLWDFVVEADLTGLWSLPKRQRYLPLMAGSLLDSVLASLFFLLLFANRQGWAALSSVPLRVAKLMLITYLTRVMWQGFLFVRTDYYYVLATLFNCRSLLSDTEAFLRNQLARALPWIARVDQSAIPASERRVIPIYAVVWVAGRIVALSWLFSVTIPLARRYIGNLGHVILAGYSTNRYDFIDAVLLVCIFILPIAAGMPMWIWGMIRGVIASLAPAPGRAAAVQGSAVPGTAVSGTAVSGTAVSGR